MEDIVSHVKTINRIKEVKGHDHNSHSKITFLLLCGQWVFAGKGKKKREP